MKNLADRLFKNPKSSWIAIVLLVVVSALAYFDIIDIQKLQNVVLEIGAGIVAVVLLFSKDIGHKKDKDA